MPPGLLATRVAAELNAQLDRLFVPLRARWLSERVLLRALEAPSLDELWRALARRPYPTRRSASNLAEYERVCPSGGRRVLESAEAAVRRNVRLLGTGPIELGERIDWHRDYRSGARWEPQFAGAIDYADLQRDSDVKLPWEISRLQWLIPAGQAYLLTGDEKYADAVR